MHRAVTSAPAPQPSAGGETEHARVVPAGAPSAAPGKNALRAMSIAALIAAPLVTLLFIAKFAVNVAEWDHLIASELFTSWSDGTLTASRLFAQHNEHRPVVPRLVVMGLGRLTRFNSVPELYLQWVLLVCTSVLIARAFARETTVGRRWNPAALVPIVLLLFSVRQYEILLIGEGLLTYLSLLFVVSALYGLIARPPTPASLALAIAAAVFASFSQSNALLIWPIGVLVLAFGLRTRGEHFGPRAVAMWAIAGAVVLWVYFRDYADPANHPTARFLLDNPSAGILYFLTLGGTPLGGERWIACTMGVVMLLFEMTVTRAVATESWRRREPLPLGIWLIVVAVATQVMITANRAGFGLEQALASRYSTYLALAPIGVYWCICAARTRWALPREWALPSLVTVLLVGWMAASAEGWAAGQGQRDVHAWRAYLLYTAKYQPDSVLEDLYALPEHARVYAAGLEKLGLSVFAEDHVDTAQVELTTVRPPFFIDLISGQPAAWVKTLEVSGDQAVTIDGWALDARASRPASAVFVSIDGTLDIPSLMAGDRPDLATVFHSQAARGAGFRASFSAALLPPGVHRVSLKIVEPDRVRGFLTEPLFDIVKR